MLPRARADVHVVARRSPIGELSIAYLDCSLKPWLLCTVGLFAARDVIPGLSPALGGRSIGKWFAGAYVHNADRTRFPVIKSTGKRQRFRACKATSSHSLSPFLPPAVLCHYSRGGELLPWRPP